MAPKSKAQQQQQQQQQQHDDDDDGMEGVAAASPAGHFDDEDDEFDASTVQEGAVLDNVDAMDAETAAAAVLKPHFPPVSASELIDGMKDTRRVLVPPHRFTPLKENWLKIYTPVVEHMKLQIRMNLKSKRVELRTSQVTQDVGSLQKGADFVRAFMMGFEIDVSFSHGIAC